MKCAWVNPKNGWVCGDSESDPTHFHSPAINGLPGLCASDCTNQRRACHPFMPGAPNMDLVKLFQAAMKFEADHYKDGLRLSALELTPADSFDAIKYGSPNGDGTMYLFGRNIKIRFPAEESIAIYTKTFTQESL